MARNLAPFAAIAILLLCALLVGLPRTQPSSVVANSGTVDRSIPCIGRIQVLNGCGIAGAADRIADHLRRKRFDVKNIGNASAWNYPFTMVISRVSDMTVARQVATALSTDRCMLMRNDDSTYDVTVIIGPDFSERIP